MGDLVLMQQQVFSVIDLNATITELAGVLLKWESRNITEESLIEAHLSFFFLYFFCTRKLL